MFEAACESVGCRKSFFSQSEDGSQYAEAGDALLKDANERHVNNFLVSVPICFIEPE